MEDKIVYVPVSVDKSGNYILTNSSGDTFTIDPKYNESFTDFMFDEYKKQQLSELLKEKDEQIKELVNTLAKLVLLKINKDKFGKDENYERMQPQAWEAAKSILQKHNAVTKQ